MTRSMLVFLCSCVLASACAHGGGGEPSEGVVEHVEAGRLVWQGHAPSQNGGDVSLVKLELELRAGDTVLSQPSVVTLPYSDAVVRQSFVVGTADASHQATLDLTLRPAAVEGKRCMVRMRSKMVSEGAPPEPSRDRVMRTPTGKWVAVIADQPIQVRMRCSQNASTSTVAAR